MDDPGYLMAVPDPQSATAQSCESPKTRFLADHCGSRGVPPKAVVHDLSGFWPRSHTRFHAGFRRTHVTPRATAIGNQRRTLRPDAHAEFRMVPARRVVPRARSSQTR